MYNNLQDNVGQRSNRYHGLFSAGLILAWLVTPETLMLVNRGAGLSGGVVVVALCIGAIFTMSSAAVIHNPQLIRHGYDNDVKVLRAVIGREAGLAVVLSGRVPLLLFVSTGMLVSAGYAFNEIFLFWFPNFLFAFLLLACITLVNTFTRSCTLMLQSFSVGLMVLGMLVLIVMGFNDNASIESSNTGSGQGVTPLLIAMCCVPFLGFDFHRPLSDNGMVYNGVVYICLIAGLALLALWAAMAIGTVAPHRLAETAIAHMLVARSVAGELGRYVMGMVVISGVVAGVNGLFIVMKRLYADIIDESLGPHGGYYSWVVVLVTALGIFAMMMTGVAGEALLESQIRATIVLWMVYVGLRLACAGHLLKSGGMCKRISGYLLGSLALMAAGALTAADPEKAYMAMFVLKTLVGMLLVSLVYTMAFAKNKKTNIL